MIKRANLSLALASLILVGCSPSPTDETPALQTGTDTSETAQTLHIYSARHYDADALLYKAFEDAEGVTVQVREAKSDQLLETMKAEGANSPADIVIASDAGALWRFQDAGLTQAVESELLNERIDTTDRQSDGHWFGLARRIRLVAYDPDRISPDQVDTWQKLASPDLEDEICVRSSSNIYNLSLMAEMISQVGATEAEDWAAGVVANMARTPQGGDTDQIKAVAAGECSIAITNHYYWVRLLESNSQSDRQVAEKTALIVPTFSEDSGSHVNITGAAITSMASDVDLAAKFIAFLMSTEGQELLTLDTKEYPLNADASISEGLAQVPSVVRSNVSLETFGENQAEAQRIYDLAGWN